jgi:hypothetical protein
MRWRDELLGQLEATVPCGYFARGEAASEPTALAGLALATNGRQDAARRAADWLVERQEATGAIGVTATHDSPCWPTALALLLWKALDEEQYLAAIAAANDWALAEKGETLPMREAVGHDSMLLGWSWAANTHSWLEPTAMFVLALKAIGKREHPRTREAVRLLVDRLLPSGGCNYGNTVVLGQELLPHLQPTGIVMLALGDEQIDDPRIGRSLEYLGANLSADTAAASLCYGTLGLTAHRQSPTDKLEWLEMAHERTMKQGASPYKLALISLASTHQLPFVANT